MKTNEIMQGDSLSFTTSVPSYPATAGWTLTYSLRGPSSLDLVATASGTDYQIVASPAQTALLAPGTYAWVAYVSQTGTRYTIDRGTLVVKLDITTQAAGYDGRSTAAIALAAAEAALATYKSTAGRVKSYTIGDRTMTFEDVPSILQEISYWKMKVRTEMTADKIANGLGNPRKLHVRFGTGGI